jgi:hypothetical protein
MHGPAADAINLKKLSAYLHNLLADTSLRDGPHPKNLRVSFSALAESGEPTCDVFIPSGTDCDSAVDEMWEGNQVFGGDRAATSDPYEAVIPRPKHEQDSSSVGGGGNGSITTRAKIDAADIQSHSSAALFAEMEAKLKAHLQELSGKPAEELPELYPNAGANAAASGSGSKPAGIGSSATASSSGPASLTKSSSAMKLQSAAAKITAASGDKKDGKPSAQDAQNYFQSLLNKKDGKKSSRPSAPK